MAANPHLEPPVAMLGAPLEEARAAVIVLHGRSQSAALMEEHVLRRLALADLAYIAPNAAGSTWYPAGFMAKLEDNQPHLDHALERVEALAADLERRGVPQVVLGFSQGACLACEHVYRRRRAPAALIAFTGGLIGPPGTAWPDDGEALRGVPVLLGGGAANPWVPAARMLETADAFARMGARVTLQLDRAIGHEVADAQIAQARALLAAVPPR